MDQVQYKSYQMLLTTDDQVVIDKKIKCFGKWTNISNDFCTKGVVYAILGDGDFDGCVKFLNNSGHVDEASTKMFALATGKEYSSQFKKLEEKSEPIKEEIKKNIKKKK
jgi:hypothetical protein